MRLKIVWRDAHGVVIGTRFTDDVRLEDAAFEARLEMEDMIRYATLDAGHSFTVENVLGFDSMFSGEQRMIRKLSFGVPDSFLDS